MFIPEVLTPRSSHWPGECWKPGQAGIEMLAENGFLILGTDSCEFRSLLLFQWYGDLPPRSSRCGRGLHSTVCLGIFWGKAGYLRGERTFVLGLIGGFVSPTDHRRLGSEKQTLLPIRSPVSPLVRVAKQACPFQNFRADALLRLFPLTHWGFVV
jgi:hypothetical protein